MDTDKIAKDVAELKKANEALAAKIVKLEEEVARLKKEILDLSESVE
jgi:cell division protein FtsB